MYKVQVLLSSYNGEKFISEQIDSILEQKDVEVKILIRDDGSSDSTLDIIAKYHNDNIEVIKANNVGATKSFFELIRLAGDADYYAFSDQDDVWLDYKLSAAVNKLKDHDNIPAVYCSNTLLVDSNLNLIKKENKKPKISLESALIKNYATGCTVVFNKELMKFLKMNTNVDVPYHDWWVNLVALSIGGVSIFDDNAYIKYRQHGNNVVGGSGSFWLKWKSRLKRFFGVPFGRDVTASIILEIYKGIESNKRAILNLLANYRNNKATILFSKNITSGNIIVDVLFRISLIFERI